jgi:hypothetical protein
MSEVKTNKLTASTGTAITLGDSGDTFTVPSGATLAVASGGTITNSGTATGFGGDNTPSFQARNRSNQTSLTSGTFYKIEYDTEDWDTDSAYDNATNYRFTVPAGEGGKYYFHANVDAYTDSGSGYVIQSAMVFYVNGAASNYYVVWDWRDNSGHGINRGNFTSSSVISLSATDYVEVYLRLSTQSSVVWKTGDMLGWFTGYKLIGI